MPLAQPASSLQQPVSSSASPQPAASPFFNRLPLVNRTTNRLIALRKIVSCSDSEKTACHLSSKTRYGMKTSQLTSEINPKPKTNISYFRNTETSSLITNHRLNGHNNLQWSKSIFMFICRKGREKPQGWSIHFMWLSRSWWILWPLKSQKIIWLRHSWWVLWPLKWGQFLYCTRQHKKYVKLLERSTQA